MGTYCYYDPTATSPVSYCAANTDTRAEGQSCQTATACFITTPVNKSLHCVGVALGQSGICRSYCDVAAGMQGCLQTPLAQLCLQINGAPNGLGYCQPQ